MNEPVWFEQLGDDDLAKRVRIHVRACHARVEALQAIVAQQAQRIADVEALLPRREPRDE